jgi:hypothetical protein
LLGVLALWLVGGTTTALAQLSADSTSDRMRALNAVFRFRSDLQTDSVLIARCRLPTAASDTGDMAGLDERFQSLLVRPDPARVSATTPCPVAAFADPNAKVLWLQDMVEISRTPVVGGPLPATAIKQFELTFQLTVGPGYREYHTYIVAPVGGVPIDSSGHLRDRFSEWRVSNYRLSGWDFHWADTTGHGSIIRRERPWSPRRHGSRR